MMRNSTFFTSTALLAVALTLGGCLRPKHYDRPASPVPAQWSTGAASETGASSAPEAASIPWREFFKDEKLQSVIELALNNNRDLRIAALNVERVEAMYRIQRAQQFPTIGADASANLYRMPETSTFGAFSVPQAAIVRQYSLNVGVSAWELDLFGRIRSLKDQALEQYLATEQARSGTQITLISAVASSYLALAADRDSLRLAQATLETQQASLDLIQKTRDSGIASDLEVNQAKSLVESANAEIARLNGQVAVDVNALELLVGARVDDSLLPAELGNEDSLRELSAGLPSEVLLQRPDILSAEHQLKAAYANIGVARAAYFPRISLTAAAGLMSSDLSKLVGDKSGTWSFAPQASLPIFDFGARKANNKVAELERQIAVSQYELSIQSAFREVSDSLALRGRLLEQEGAQRRLVDSLDMTKRLSDTRYRVGIDSYLSVLVAQNSLYSAQQGLIALRLARLSNLVTLYKVTGGGA